MTEFIIIFFVPAFTKPIQLIRLVFFFYLRIKIAVHLELFCRIENQIVVNRGFNSLFFFFH